MRNVRLLRKKDAMQNRKQIGLFSCSCLLIHVEELRKEIEPWVKAFCRAGNDCLYRETAIGQILKEGLSSLAEEACDY